jgi:hypothetical protein
MPVSLAPLHHQTKVAILVGFKGSPASSVLLSVLGLLYNGTKCKSVGQVARHCCKIFVEDLHVTRILCWCGIMVVSVCRYNFQVNREHAEGHYQDKFWLLLTKSPLCESRLLLWASLRLLR